MIYSRSTQTGTAARLGFILAWWFFALCHQAFGIDISVTGKVRCSVTNVALPNAIVILKGTNLSTTTNASGEFNLTTTSVDEIVASTKRESFSGSLVAYDLRGKKVAAAPLVPVIGNPKPYLSLAPGVYVFSATVNGKAIIFKHAVASVGRAGVSAIEVPLVHQQSAPLSKSLEPITIAVSKPGYFAKDVPLANNIVQGLTIALAPFLKPDFNPGDGSLSQVRSGIKASLGTDKVVFIKRIPINCNHYYTEHINAQFKPGGGLCILNLNDGSVKEFSMGPPGVVNRFDISYDGRKIVYDYKTNHMEGYRIYELVIETGKIIQLTFPLPQEDTLQALYRNRTLWDSNWDTYHNGEYNDYHHGTDDMHPCYLPDGGIVFVSSRCQIGTICDGPDIFTTTNLYRMNGDGTKIQRLSKDMVSVFTPVVMPSAEIMYHRWEYVDKGATPVKCLWSMYPDGTNSREIYGNDIYAPFTIIQGRPIPDAPGKYVATAAFHMDNAIGAIMTINTNTNIRTNVGQTNLTPERPWPVWGIDDNIDSPIPGGPGYGSFYRDPWPLSEKLYLMSHKPAGNLHWRDTAAWGLYVFQSNGQKHLFYKASKISCVQPVPLLPRVVPNIPTSFKDPALAARNKAQAMVVNVYHGMENTTPGSIKYLRVMEQLPRPWAARRGKPPMAAWWDEHGQQHAAISERTHLWAAAQWGIVTVEDDGSANFTVPAGRAIYLQALDAEYRMIQHERTYVNYQPGERASCIGCHEMKNDAIPNYPPRKAFQRPPEDPKPQPGETSPEVVLNYADQVQPIWDRNCMPCHNSSNLKGGLDLSGTMTTLFNRSYESLVTFNTPRRELLGFLIDELGTDTEYRPAHKLFGNQSVLLKMLGMNVWNLTNAQKETAARLRAACNPNLTTAEKAVVARWIDNNCQYYGSYWGRRNLQFKSHQNFRIKVTFEQAVGDVPPIFDISD